MEIMDMAGWPATPGPVRLSRAEAVISEDAHQVRSILDGRNALPDEAHRDARMLLGVLEIMDFSAWAHGEAERLVRAGRINSALDIAEVALQGTSERFIGTVIHLTEGTSEQEEYILTLLYRDHEWAGLNQNLPRCRNMAVRIFGRSNPTEDPAMIIAAPAWAARTGNEAYSATQPAGDLGRAIHAAMTWHGARNCSWYDSTAGPEKNI